MERAMAQNIDLMRPQDNLILSFLLNVSAISWEKNSSPP